MDCIFIRDLAIRCIIGIYPKERRVKQTVLLNIRIGTQVVENAARSDRIEDTVDYKALKQTIRAFVIGGKFQLIETMAVRVSELCLENPMILEATVSVDKPGALRYARSVAVEVTRRRGVL